MGFYLHVYLDLIFQRWINTYLNTAELWLFVGTLFPLPREENLKLSWLERTTRTTSDVIGEPLASVSESVWYPSNARYYSSFRRTRLPHSSARLAFPSTFPGKGRHVRAETARYGEKLQLIVVFMASLSLNAGFDAIIYLVVDVY